MSLPAVAIEYFEYLTAGRFAEASRCFSEDAFYSHPACDPDLSGPASHRMEASGRQAIERLFEARGPRDWTHASRADTVGDRFYVEGRVTEKSGAELLSAVGLVGMDGLIARYVAYDSRPPVGRAGEVA
ncbi:hypothetical protein AB0B25_15715 [Nocardia sp. NPDC049190]|uniref:hypothetical protein n=1 Tax=Nocardia sp. NPDC049190 TaxID=3155650 RepID=UPI0033FDCC6C